MANPKNDPLSSISEEKQKITERLAELERQEAELFAEQAQEVVDKLIACAMYVSPEQARAIMKAIAPQPRPDTRHRLSTPRRQVAPKYWLPHSGETWTGRGRTPKAFVAWEGSAAYSEWKAGHPDEKFPAFPG